MLADSSVLIFDRKGILAIFGTKRLIACVFFNLSEAGFQHIKLFALGLDIN